MIQARAIGATVFLDREDMAGEYVRWNCRSSQEAAFVAEAINEALADSVAGAEEGWIESQLAEGDDD
jgi:hypothetical protein